MEGKPVTETSLVTSILMTPQDANVAGNIHGGVIMRLIDENGAIVAIRHSRCNVVTASTDHIDFISPIYIGNLVTLKASLNFVGKTSMEVGIRVESEDLFTGECRHCATGYVTYVALDKNGKPTVIPPLILKTKEEKRRNVEAIQRRVARLQGLKSKQASV